MKVEVAVLGSPPRIVRTVSVGLCGRKATLNSLGSRPQELCESPGGRPGLPVPDSLNSLCGCKATFKRNAEPHRWLIS